MCYIVVVVVQHSDYLAIMLSKLKKSALKHNYSTIRGSTGDKWTELLAGGWNFRRTDAEGFCSSMRLWSHPTLSSEFMMLNIQPWCKSTRTNIVGGVQFVGGRLQSHSPCGLTLSIRRSCWVDRAKLNRQLSIRSLPSTDSRTAGVSVRQFTSQHRIVNS